MRPPEPGWVEIEDERVVARCGWVLRKTTMKVKPEALMNLVFEYCVLSWLSSKAEDVSKQVRCSLDRFASWIGFGRRV